MPLQQYRACVVDSLGLGITCVIHCTMCTSHPNVISFAFYAIPIFHILAFTCNVLLEVVCCCFPRNELFMYVNMTFVRSQSFISPPSFMFVSAVVSEICELNQKEKEKNNWLFPF